MCMAYAALRYYVHGVWGLQTGRRLRSPKFQIDVCQPSRLLYLNGRVSLVRCMSTKSTFILQWKGLLRSMYVNQVDLYSSMEGSP